MFRIISLMPKDKKMSRKPLPKRTEKQRGFPEGEVRASLIVSLLINYFMQDRMHISAYLSYQNNNILCGSGQFYIINNTSKEEIPSQTLLICILTCCCLQVFFEKQTLNLHKKIFPILQNGFATVYFLIIFQYLSELSVHSITKLTHAALLKIFISINLLRYFILYYFLSDVHI